jgi:hypothetical protein
MAGELIGKPTTPLDVVESGTVLQREIVVDYFMWLKGLATRDLAAYEAVKESPLVGDRRQKLLLGERVMMWSEILPPLHELIMGDETSVAQGLDPELQERAEDQ